MNSKGAGEEGKKTNQESPLEIRKSVSFAPHVPRMVYINTQRSRLLSTHYSENNFVYFLCSPTVPELSSAGTEAISGSLGPRSGPESGKIKGEEKKEKRGKEGEARKGEISGSLCCSQPDGWKFLDGASYTRLALPSSAKRQRSLNQKSFMSLSAF